MSKSQMTEVKFPMKKALTEAFFDTGFASIINIPLNYLLILWIVSVEMDPGVATLLMTGAFFSIALVRKTYVRYLFWRRENIS